MKIEVYLPDDISEFIESLPYGDKTCIIGALKEGLVESFRLAVDSHKQAQLNVDTSNILSNLLKKN